MKYIKLLLALLLVSSAAGAVTRAPDFVWRRAAFSQPFNPSASASGLLGIRDGSQCFVLRSSDGLLLKTFFELSYSCDQAVLSSDGRFVALGLLTIGPTAAIRVYETAGWTQVITIFAQPPDFPMPVFSPDSQLLAFSSDRGTTKVYDVGSWSLRMTLSGIGPISISPDSRLIALRSDSNSIRLYRLEDGAEVTPPSGFGASNHYLLGNDWIALAANDGIRIETIVEPPQVIAALAARRIQPLAISPDARWLAGIFDGGPAGATLQLWDTKSFSSVGAWSIGSSFSTIARVAFPSNVSIVSVDYDTSQIYLWSVPDGHFLESLNADRGLSTPLVFSPDGIAVAAGFGPGGNIRAWTSSDGLPFQTIAGSDRLASLAFSNDGQYLVGGGERLHVWSWPDGNPVQSVSEATLEVAVSSRGVVAQRTENEIRLRSLPDLALVRTISQGGPIAFSPDGSLIVVGADLFEVDTGVRVQAFRLSPFVAAAFSPDGTNVILSEAMSFDPERGYLDRFEVASGDLLARFGYLRSYFPSGWANSLSFSPDGTRLAQFSIVPSFRFIYVRLRIWDGYGLLYEDYDDDLGFGGGFSNESHQLRYSPDGRSLAVTSVGPPSVFGIVADPCADDACASRMLPISQLNDEFQEDRPDPGLWDVYASRGTVSTGTNGLTLRPDPGSVDTALLVSSKRSFSLLNSNAKVQVPEVVGSGDVNTMFMLQVDWNNSVQWWYENGVWSAISYVNGVRNVHAELSGGAGYTLQIREAEGTVYWETCDGSPCTTRATTPTSSLFPVDALRLLFTAATFGTGSPAPGQARYRSLNPPPIF